MKTIILFFALSFSLISVICFITDFTKALIKGIHKEYVRLTFNSGFIYGYIAICLWTYFYYLN